MKKLKQYYSENEEIILTSLWCGVLVGVAFVVGRQLTKNELFKTLGAKDIVVITEKFKGIDVTMAVSQATLIALENTNK